MRKLRAASSRFPLPVLVLAAVVVLESGLRLCGFAPALPDVWEPESAPVSLAGDGLHRASTRQLWEPIPHAPIPWCPGEQVNLAGFRGPDLPRDKRPGVVRIAVLGDADTFGAGVAWQETYVACVGRELEARGLDTEVLDAGVVSFTAVQGLMRYEELVRPYRPDLVVAAFSGLQEQMPSPYLTDWARIDRSLLQSRDWTWLGQDASFGLRVLQLGRWLNASAKPEEPRLAKERERQASSAEQSGSFDWPGLRRVPVPNFEACLRRLARAVREDGASLLLVSMPHHPGLEAAHPVLVEYDSTVWRVASSEQLAVHGARQHFQQVLTGGSEPDALFRQRLELAPRGHALLAEGLADAIVAELARR